MSSICLEHIAKSYGHEPAVCDLSLEIKEKELIILLGPSGCGKSTTLNIIAGLVPQDTGHVYVDGKIVDDVTPDKRSSSELLSIRGRTARSTGTVSNRSWFTLLWRRHTRRGTTPPTVADEYPATS